jgi:hypothetical protein
MLDIGCRWGQIALPAIDDIQIGTAKRPDWWHQWQAPAVLASGCARQESWPLRLSHVLNSAYAKGKQKGGF